jgi:uncharacterized protein
VLITLFLDDRRARIEVGYGLEGAIPDALAGNIIREVMAPRLRDGQVEEALHDAIDVILDAAKREPGGTVAAPARGGRPPSLGPMLVFALVVLVVLVAVGSTQRPRRGGWSGGGDGWAEFAGRSFLWSALWSALSGGGRSRRGGGFGGGGVGDGGFGDGGGFGGGGGRFGGGGASGSW